MIGIPSSLSKELIHVISATVWAIALYLASALDLAITYYFFEL